MSGPPSDPPVITVARRAEFAAALRAGQVERGRPVVVLVGGAGGMDEATMAALRTVLTDGLVPMLGRRAAAVVDGGTDSGIMQMIGRARAASATFPLVGVAAQGTVVIAGREPPMPDAAALEPNHSLVLLVPGRAWGDEVDWIADAATVLADGHPSVTLLINGGQIAYRDVDASLRQGRPVVVAAGSGRTADAIADARNGADTDPRAREAAASPLVHVVPVDRPAALAAEIDALLAGP